MSAQSNVITSMTRMLFIGALVAAGLAACPVAALPGSVNDAAVQSGVVDMDVYSDEYGARVTFSAATPIVYRSKRMVDPVRLALWFPQTTMAPALTAAPILLNDGALTKVLVAHDTDDPSLGKAVLYLRDHSRVRQEVSDDQRTLTITLGSPRADGGTEIEIPAEPTPQAMIPACAVIEDACIERRTDRPGVELHIIATRPVTFEKRDRGVDRLSVDIQDAVLGEDTPRSIPIRSGGVQSVRLAQLSLQPPVVRATLELDTSADHAVRMLSDSRTVAIDLSPLAANAALEERHSAPAPLGAISLPAALGGVMPASPNSVYSEVITMPKAEEAEASADETGSAPAPAPAPFAQSVSAPAPGFSSPFSGVGVGGTVHVAQADRPRRPEAESPAVDPTAPSLADPGIRFSGTSLGMALQLLAYHYDENVIVDDSVQGTLSMTLAEDVSFEEALGLITMMKDLAWKNVGEAYVVAAKDQIQHVIPPGARSVRTYVPQMLAPTALVSILERVHPAVYAQAEEEAGVVILVGIEDEVRDAIETLSRVDGGEAASTDAMTGVGVSGLGAGTHVFELTGGNPTEIADFVKSIVGEGVEINAQPGTPNLVVQGTPAKVREAVGLLTELQAKTGEYDTKVFEPMPNADGSPADIATLGQALTANFAPYVEVTPGADGGSVMLRGPARTVEAAIRFARQFGTLDTKGYESIDHYDVTNAIDPAVLARLAYTAYPRCRFEVEASAARIVAMGPTADVTDALLKLADWDTLGSAESIPYDYPPICVDALDLKQQVDLLALDLDSDVRGVILHLEGSPVAIEQAMATIRWYDRPAAEKPPQPAESVTVQLDHVDVTYAKNALTGYLQVAGNGASVLSGTSQGPTASVGNAQFGMGGFGPFMSGGQGVMTPVSMGGSQGQPGSAGAVGGAEEAPDLKEFLAVVEDELTHRLTLVGPRNLIDRALALIDEIDVPQHQVTMNAMIVDWDRTDGSDIGTQWSFGSIRWTEHGSQAPFGTEQTGLSDKFYNGGIMFSTLDRGVFDFQSLLNFVKTSTSAKLLARPNVKALDGQQARIQIGDEFRFQTVQLQAAQAQPLFTTETVDAGIILQFTPRIANDGTVTAELLAEVSTIAGYVDGIPQLATRKAETTVRLLDGQTMVIGGLIREDEIEILEKLPILGDIPFFGRLFQNRRTSRRPQELLIFLTPQIEYADGDHLVAEKPVF